LKKALIVIGMHRSGTSAISGLLNELGVFMGKSLFAAQAQVNEKGFFENAEVVKLNENIFDEQLKSWDFPLSGLQVTAKQFAFNQDITAQLSVFINKEYGSHSVWGMKDPRTSMHLPLWDNAITSNNIKPCYILMLRNPLEVASSLKKRDGFSTEKSLLLWLQYTLNSYWFCKDKSLFCVDFDELLSSPTNVQREIATVFDISLPCLKTGFIEPHLKHNTISRPSQEEAQLYTLAVDLYDALTSKPANDNIIKNIKTEYENILAKYGELLGEHANVIKKEEIHYRTLFLEAYHSFWWKLAFPFRKLERFIRR